jgi:hypothetical protein
LVTWCKIFCLSCNVIRRVYRQAVNMSKPVSSYFLLLGRYNSGTVLAFSTICFHLRRSWTCSAHFISVTFSNHSWHHLPIENWAPICCMLFTFRALTYHGMSFAAIRCVPKWEISIFHKTYRRIFWGYKEQESNLILPEHDDDDDDDDVSKERRGLEACAAQDNLWLLDRNM